MQNEQNNQNKMAILTLRHFADMLESGVALIEGDLKIEYHRDVIDITTADHLPRNVYRPANIAHHKLEITVSYNPALAGKHSSE